ncbi:MAG: RNA methyltransferase [Clostridiales bacterium]|jgi:TrmH family RNA methyltransferase|nr:RNA methyltransferase [Clostridiales bacterium]
MITSTANEKIKAAASLKEKKFRDLTGLYLIEGERLVRQALQSGIPLKEIYVTDAVANADFLGAELVTQAVLNKLADTVTPQGVVAVAARPSSEFVLPEGNGIILDGVSAPDNVGAVIRTAAALGYGDVYLRGCADAYAPKAVRASMGGIFYARTREVTYEQLCDIKKSGVEIIGADMAGEPLRCRGPSEKFAVVIGGEAFGISEDVRGLCSGFVSIPIAQIESLNAAVSAGIIMYALKNSND